MNWKVVVVPGLLLLMPGEFNTFRSNSPDHPGTVIATILFSPSMKEVIVNEIMDPTNTRTSTRTQHAR